MNLIQTIFCDLEQPKISQKSTDSKVNLAVSENTALTAKLTAILDCCQSRKTSTVLNYSVLLTVLTAKIPKNINSIIREKNRYLYAPKHRL